MKQDWNPMEGIMVERCCLLSMRAHSSQASSFLLRSFTDPLLCSVFAFRASWSASDWITDDPFPDSSFGESFVDASLFPSLRSLCNDVPALVNLAFLRSFQKILAEGSFQAEVHRVIAEKKQIVFTGHSFGGAMSVLATIWLLEQCVKFDNSNQVIPFCLTFGSPLVGDDVFCHSLHREGWSRCFFHFVMPLDIIPRMLLTPMTSFKEELQAILHVVCPKSLYFSLDTIGNSQLVTFFYSTILRNALLLSCHRACLSMGCANPLFGSLSAFVKLSPYRPVGTFCFFTRKGRLVNVKNSDAILHLLFYFLQLNPERELVEVAYGSLKEHLEYDTKVKENVELQNFVDVDNLVTIPLSITDALSNDRQACGVFEGLELNVEARLRLRAAGELEKQKQKNQEKVDANYCKIQEALRCLIEYRATCEIRGLGYYDTFKLQKDPEDFNANVKRLELAGLWDEILEMLRRFDLPDSFESRAEWVRLGTTYRQIVEPLDIANYYRHSKNEDTGPYITNGRPKRYRCVQRWFEQSHRMAAGSSLESCFWAMVEDLCTDTDNNRPYEDVREKVLELERKVLRWITNDSLGRDVLLHSSNFIKWWKTLPEHHKSESCIASLMSRDDKALMASISLRRMKGTHNGSISLVGLPPKTVETCLVELSSEEREQYEKMESEAKSTLREYINTDTVLRNYSTVLHIILRLRQICNNVALCPSDLKSLLSSNSLEDVTKNPELLKKLASMLEDGDDFDCPVCLSPPAKTIITCCAHIFCQKCILKTLKTLNPRCPICRRQLSETDLFLAPQPKTSDDENPTTDFSGLAVSSKVSALLNLLLESKRQNESTKSVIFSQFRKMLILLEEPLMAAGFGVLRLDGSMSMKKRMEVIKEFGSKRLNSPTVLLASLKAAGTGINLTTASRVYLVEPWWNPAAEEQAMDRVHRIGQKEEVKVVRLIVKDSIEERILVIQERKKKLAGGLFGKKAAKEQKEMRVEDIRTMLRL